MEKRGEKGKAEIILIVLVVILVIHLTVHFIYFGTGIPYLGETGISGRAVTGDVVNPIESIQSFQRSENISKYVVLGEWLIVILLILYVLIKGRVSLTKDTKGKESIKKIATIKYKKKGLETDIDVLLRLLNEKKTIRISTIAETFGVSNSTAFGWSNILEDNNLAIIKYPLVGSAKLSLAGTNEEEPGIKKKDAKEKEDAKKMEKKSKKHTKMTKHKKITLKKRRKHKPTKKSSKKKTRKKKK